MAVALFLIVSALALLVYAYGGYPLCLAILAKRRRRASLPGDRSDWPMVSICVPAYNEEKAIQDTLQCLLNADYPAQRRQIVVVSDASTDRTDEIVSGFADRGVELLRLPKRGGKTAAENAARSALRGDIVVNTDASVRIAPDGLKPLIAAFADPTVGVASGRDVSVASLGAAVRDGGAAGESGYVGYEMWLRSLETRVDGIIGASGCFYAIRRDLHMHSLPPMLSRDFAAPLVAREHGYRAVSVDDAVCYVPRTTSLRREYRRKVRTITRGLQTLWHKRRLLNPVRFGGFAWMLMSHKVCRWLVPVIGVTALVGIMVLAWTHAWAQVILGVVIATAAVAWFGWHWPAERPMPRIVALPSFAVLGNVAVIEAWIKAVRGQDHSVWEPTRRPVQSRSRAPNATARD